MCFPLCTYLPVCAKMDLLTSLKIAIDGHTSETVGALTSLSLDTCLTIRDELFKQTLTLNLVCKDDVLVSRTGEIQERRHWG